MAPMVGVRREITVNWLTNRLGGSRVEWLLAAGLSSPASGRCLYE